MPVLSHRRRLPLAGPGVAGVLLALLVGCVDDPAVQEQQRRAALQSPSPSPSAAASGVVGPSSAPSLLPPPAGVPGASGVYVRTGEPLDLAVSGPGYFVLSPRPEPGDLSELRFTRQGRFIFSFASEASPAPAAAPVANAGQWRLMTPEGLYVLGYAYAGTDAAPVPAEGSGRSLAAFTLGGTVPARGLGVAGATNPNFSPRFTYRGQLWSLERAPLDEDGQTLQAFVAIAQFETPQGLAALPGGTQFAYQNGAGLVRSGVAGVRAIAGQAARPVGETNGIEPGTLER